MTTPLGLGAIEELPALERECRHLTFGEPMCSPMSRYRFALLTNASALIGAAQELLELKDAIAALSECAPVHFGSFSIEAIRFMASKAATMGHSQPTKPEVVDGEVTGAHREAAAHFAENRDSGDIDELATLISTAESRGFAAGRASVTAKAEGQSEAAWAVEVLDAWAERSHWRWGMSKNSEDSWMCRTHPLAEGMKKGTRMHYGESAEAARIAAARALYAADQTLPAPPAPADTELKGET